MNHGPPGNNGRINLTLEAEDDDARSKKALMWKSRSKVTRERKATSIYLGVKTILINMLTQWPMAAGDNDNKNSIIIINRAAVGHDEPTPCRVDEVQESDQRPESQSVPSTRVSFQFSVPPSTNLNSNLAFTDLDRRELYHDALALATPFSWSPPSPLVPFMCRDPDGVKARSPQPASQTTLEPLSTSSKPCFSLQISLQGSTVRGSDH
ncbi:hypothetical protein BJX61DRAFT_123530 [Aspergillus egyptiacus]|nr:hypothetical protein BJX61DRAFT_123530 [Aspergillus egyptiacus]